MDKKVVLFKKKEKIQSSEDVKVAIEKIFKIAKFLGLGFYEAFILTTEEGQIQSKDKVYNLRNIRRIIVTYKDLVKVDCGNCTFFCETTCGRFIPHCSHDSDQEILASEKHGCLTRRMEECQEFGSCEDFRNKYSESLGFPVCSIEELFFDVAGNHKIHSLY